MNNIWIALCIHELEGGLHFGRAWFQILATFYRLMQHKIQEGAFPLIEEELFYQTWVIMLKFSLLDTMPQEE